MPNAKFYIMFGFKIFDSKILNSENFSWLSYAYFRISDGHTHGGQLYVFAPMMYMGSPYYHGLYRPSARTQVYVGCGTMFFGSPLKIYGFMQIPVIVLRRGDA